MPAILQTKGMTFDAYRMSFRAMRSLWRETGTMIAIAITQFVLINFAGRSFDSPFISLGGLFYIAFSIIYIPYLLVIYRYCLDLERLSIKNSLTQSIRARYFIVYEIGWQLITSLWGEAQKTDSLLLMLSIFIGAGGLLLWLRIRLVVLGLILAVPNLNVTAKDAFRATEGRAWDIFFIAFRASLPLVVIMVAVILSVSIAIGPLSDENRSLQIVLFQIVFLPIGFIGLVLRTVVEVQIFQRLGLPSRQHEVE